MEYDSAANHIFSLSSDHIPKRQLDSAVTILLLLKSRPDWARAYKGLREGRYRIDSRLVVMLLGTADKNVQAAIVHSAAFWHLPRRLFRRHFFRFWRLRRGERFWRWVLGRTLHPFLMNHGPQEGPVYAKVIWTLARDPDEAVALTGLNCTQFTGSVLTQEQAKTLISLTRRKSMKAFAAKSNIGSLYKDFENLKPEVKALFLDPRTIATLRVNHDPSDTDKWGAHNWCLMNMRKALGRSRWDRVSER